MELVFLNLILFCLFLLDSERQLFIIKYSLNIVTVCGIHCAVYHADMPLKVRKDVHEKFVKDIIPVVCATVAFGMGIDKPGEIINLLFLM